MTDEEIFAKAIDLPAGQRADFVTQVCCDSNQRERVAALLSAHGQGDSLLDTHDLPVDTWGDGRHGLPKHIGDFEILRELGRGGMGVVYQAHQKSLKRKVALKILSSSLGLSSKAILRFRREAEAAGKLHHTNIVPIYTTGEDRGIHYYAMELIDGPSLDTVIKDLKRQYIGESSTNGQSDELPAWVHETALYSPDSRNGRPPESGQLPVNRGEASPSASQSSTSGSSISSGGKFFDEVASMMADVADALHHAHEHGVIHRDIKPSNLLLAPDGRLSINDFGLARMLEQPGMTISGEFVGSPLYMSPEQITAGRAPLDHRTDIYSLGATLYELLTLQPPFPGETRDQVIGQILHKEPVPPRRINGKVPVDLDTICMKAIGRDPDSRYQTANQLAKDLRAFVNRHAISAKRLGPLAIAKKWIRRNPVVSALLVLVAVMIGVMGYFIYLSDQDRREQIEESLDDSLLLAFNGQFEEADAKLDLARELNATESQLKLMQAVLDLMEEKDASNIVVDLENVYGESASYNTTAYSVLTVAYMRTGQEANCFLRLPELVDRAAPTYRDRLFKGWAENILLPDQAVSDLERR